MILVYDGEIKIRITTDRNLKDAEVDLIGNLAWEFEEKASNVIRNGFEVHLPREIREKIRIKVFQPEE